MALLVDNKEIKLTGDTVTSYVNIQKVTVTKEDGVFNILINTAAFKSKDIRDNGGAPFERKRYRSSFDETSSDSAYVQAYNHLKTLDDFSGAIDA